MKLLNLIFFCVIFNAISYSQCKIIYVTTTGTGTGTKASPSSLTNAIAIATKKDVIKLGNGTYNIDNPINLIDSITFEGGFLPASNWIKTSLVGTTIINRTTFNPEGVANAQRLVAFYANNKSGFRFQDITITTANANLAGMSTYGVHLTNCSNYNFVRVQVTAGAAAAGSNGVAGSAGLAGGVGVNGSNGSCDGGTCTFSSGNPGAAGGNGGTGGGSIAGGAGGAAVNSSQNNGAVGTTGTLRNGGGGGGGGAGGDECSSSNGGNGASGGGSACSSSGLGGVRGGQGDPGVAGSNGTAGTAGTIGSAGLLGSLGSHFAGFWQPGSAGGIGSDGCGGSGGGGGGGGGRQTCTFCDQGPGNGAGGGGGGGQGGTGGTGGTGGGSSFAVYLYNNGTNGNFIQCSLVSGTAGSGGAGGAGGNGGTGGNGGVGASTCIGEIGRGGNGGVGGAGGTGGAGGSGSAGISVNLHQNGGTAPNSSIITFNLVGQLEIKFDHQICANSVNTFTAASSSIWAFGSVATPTTATGSIVTTTYQTTGWQDVTFNSNVYSGFVYISPFSVSNSNAGVNQNVCATTATLNGNVPTYGSGTWTSLGAASVTTPSLSNSTVTGLVSGSNKFVWTISNGGCCASSASTVDIIYTPISITVNSGAICSGQIFTIVPSGASTYSYSSGSNTVSPISNTDYTVTGTSAGGCTNTAVCSVTVNPIPSLTITASSNSICSGATITLTPSGALNYSLNPGALSSTSNFTVSPTSTTQYTLTGNDGLCSATIFPVTNITVTPSSISPTITKTDVLCNGNSTGSLTVSLSGGPYTYSLFPGGSAITATISGLAAGNYSVVVSNSCSSATVTANITEPALALSTSTAVTNVLCNGGSTGSATVTAIGGTSPYTYLWSGAQTTSVTTGQTAGVRTVTVTDANSCVTTNTTTITQPSALATSTAVTNVLCNGGSTGSATVTAIGGTSPYTYLWSTSATTSVTTGQTAGVRTVTVTDANSCATTNTVTITQPSSALATSTAVTNVLCFDNSTGSATVTVNGGTSPYTYLWSGAQTTSVTTGQTAGVRTVTVTDANSCSTNNTVTITQPSSALATSTAVTNVLCNGGSTGSATVTASGGTSPYTYLWSGAQTTSVTSGQTLGVRTVTVTDANSCSTTNTATITQPSSALAISTAVSNVLCNGGSTGSATVTASGGTSGYTYLWSTGATTSVIIGQTSGVRTVTVTDANACNTTNTVNITEPASAVSATATQTNITCVINGKANVVVTGGTGSYTYTWSPSGGNSATSSILTDGNYTCTIEDANLCSLTKTFVITSNTVLPTVAITGNTAICNGQSTVLTGSGADTYTWNTSATTTSISVNPTLTITYSVVGTNTVNGCVNTTDFILTVNPNPIITPTSSSTIICTSQSATLTAGGATTYTWNTGSNAASIAVSPTATATYTLNGTDALGCSSSNTIEITVVNTPTVLATTSNTAICAGASATLTASGATTYSWSTGATTNTIIVTPSANETFTVNGQVGAGCNSDGIVAIVVNANPTLTVNNGTICAGQTFTTIASGATTYSWSTGDLTNTITVNPISTTNYTVTGTDAVGCSDTKTISLVVNTNPTITIVASNTAICNGFSASLIASGANTYTWNTSATTNSITVNPTATTNYTVTGTDVNGCVNSSTVNLIVNANPTLTVAAINPTICEGSSTDIVATGANTYTWNTSATTATITVNPTLTTNYTVTGTDANGCVDTKTVSVIINATPTLSVNSGAICLGQSFTMTPNGAVTYTYSNGSSVDTPTINTTYTVIGTDANGCVSLVGTVSSVTVNAIPTLSVNSGAICLGQSFTMTPSGAITYTYSNGSSIDAPTTNTTYVVTGTDANGCVNTTGVVSSVTVNTLPTLSVNSGTICIGQSFTITPSGAVTYTYSNGSNIVSPIASESYTVTGTDANGCINTTGVVSSIIVNTLPNITVNANNSSICLGNTSVLTANGASTYTWNTGSNNASINVSPTNNTTYTVTGTDGNGCVNMQTQTINLFPVSTINVNTSANAICVGNTSTLTASGVNTYTWSTGSNNTTINVSPTTTTNYVVNGTDINGCNVSNNISITVNNLPNVTVSASSTGVCAGSSASLTATGANTYIWNTTETTAQIVVAPNVQTIYSVIGSNGLGCAATATVAVNMFVMPTVNLGNDVEVALGETLQLNPTQTNATTFSWTPSDYLSSTTLLNPSTTPQADIMYVLTVTSVDGCKTKDSINVKVLSDLLIANYMSPNGDGQNDTWKINVPALIKDYSVDIIDSYGQTVYSKLDNYNNEFDGKRAGQDLPDGVYYYFIKDGNAIKFKGSITLTK